MGQVITHNHCSVCGPQTFVAPKPATLFYLITTILPCGLGAIFWLIDALVREKPRCSSCGRTQAEGNQLARIKAKAYDQEMLAFEEKFERIQNIIANLTEEQIAEIEERGITGFPQGNYFDFDPPASSCVREMEHYMDKIRLEVDSMLDRLELVLGYRP